MFVFQGVHQLLALGIGQNILRHYLHILHTCIINNTTIESLRATHHTVEFLLGLSLSGNQGRKFGYVRALQGRGIRLPLEAEMVCFVFGHEEEVHHLHKVLIMLIASVRVQFFERSERLVGCGGKQQYLRIGAAVVEEATRQHGLLVVVLMEQGVEALKLVHNNQVGVEHINADFCEETAERIDSGRAFSVGRAMDRVIKNPFG